MARHQRDRGSGGQSRYLGGTETEYHHVYFGQYNRLPILWRVLANAGNATGSNDSLKDDNLNAVSNGEAKFLLSEYLFSTGIPDFDYIAFNDDRTDGNRYQVSKLKSALDSLATTSSNFSSVEQGAMLRTTKSDGAYTSSDYLGTTFSASQNILNGDKLFPLSAGEVGSTSYFPDLYDRRGVLSSDTSEENSWWLRSPDANEAEVKAGYVSYPIGHYQLYGIDSLDVENDLNYLRPAFNLYRTPVLFTSTAETGRGKETAGMDGGLVHVDVNATTEWKLTLKDAAGHGRFAVTTTAVTAPVGGSVKVSCSGAKAGANEYLSGIIFTTTGELLYYGRLKPITTATHPDGTQTGSKWITLPADLAAGTYDLRLFSEQYNGAQKTDYASEMKSVPLTITNTPTTPLEITSPTANTTVPVRIHDAPTLYVTATGTPPLTYQWERSTDGGQSYTTIPGARSSGHTLDPVTIQNNGDKYYCVVQDNGGLSTATSPIFTIQVQSATPLVITDPTADSSRTVTVGQTTALSVTATGAPPLTYQWELSTDGGQSYALVGGATGASYTTDPATPQIDGYKYRCVVQDKDALSTATGHVFTIQVTPVAPVTPVAITNPAADQSVTLTVGQTTALTVTAAGGLPPLRYQWFRSTDGGRSYSPILGATGGSYVVAPVSLQNDGEKYDCLVVDSREQSWAVSPVFTLEVAQPVGPGGGGEADAPQTGDRAMPWLWLGLMLLAGAVVGATALTDATRRRKGRG